MFFCFHNTFAFIREKEYTFCVYLFIKIYQYKLSNDESVARQVEMHYASSVAINNTRKAINIKKMLVGYTD